jgi:putative ABC transport system permease protein
MFNRAANFLRNVFRQQQVDRDLDAELRSYVDALADEKTRSGMSRELAEREARIELEGAEQVKERVREERSGALMQGAMQDVRYAGRMLVKNPGFSFAAILALALGIGANTAIFSVVNSVLLKPLPYQDPERLVVLLHGAHNPVAPANYLDWRAQNHVFSEIGAAEFWTPNLADEDRPEHLWALKLTPSMFPVLGVEPLLGRTFAASEDVAGRDHEVVLSYRIWQRRFGGDPNVLGRAIKLNGEPYTIIGVMPKSFRFAPFWATKAELWAPMAFGDRTASRNGNSLRIFARLKPGVTLEQARSEMANITAQLERQFPGSIATSTCMTCESTWWATFVRRCWFCWVRWDLSC